MVIIKAENDQYEAVRSFYHSMIDAMASGTVYVGWKKDIYPSPALLSDSIHSGELYLALEGNALVAAMICNSKCNEGYAKCPWQINADAPEVMVIHALGVHPDHQGRGYAKALVQYALDLAGKSGMKAVRLDVIEGNLPAEKLYSGFGFRYMDKQQMFYADTGWTSFLLYERLLSAE